jgi:hypothetical protein
MFLSGLRGFHFMTGMFLRQRRVVGSYDGKDKRRRYDDSSCFGFETIVSALGRRTHFARRRQGAVTASA